MITGVWKYRGKSSPAVPFQITLSECSKGTTGVRVAFNGIEDAENNTLLKLDEGSNTASGLGIEILDANMRLNRPGFPGECFICELRLPDHRFRWKHNKLFLLLPEEYGPAFPAIVDCYTSPVNATMFDRYLPFSCPLNTFVTDAVRFSPFHHH